MELFSYVGIRLTKMLICVNFRKYRNNFSNLEPTLRFFFRESFSQIPPARSSQIFSEI
jgi:hypothetical protein